MSILHHIVWTNAVNKQWLAKYQKMLTRETIVDQDEVLPEIYVQELSNLAESPNWTVNTCT